MRARKHVFGFLAGMAAVTALVTAASANSVEFDTVAGSDGDGPLSASLFFVVVNGGIAVVVYNNETGTIAKGQGISTISFGVSTISTPSAFTELYGRSFDPSSGQAWTSASGTTFTDTSSAGPINSIDHWGFNNASGVLLATANSPVPGAGNPHYMILGSTGTAGPGSSLSNSNFDPFVIGPAAFFLTVSGITTSTTLTSSNFTNVMVGFGTGPDKTLATTYNSNPTINPTGALPPHVPLPGAFWSGATLLGALAVGPKMRRKFAR